MSCKLTYNGQRFNNQEALDNYIKQNPPKGVKTQSIIDFNANRAIHVNKLSNIFDPQTLYEVTQAVAGMTTNVIDAATTKPQHKGLSRLQVAKLEGKQKIFQSVYILFGDKLFQTIYEISTGIRSFNTSNLNILENLIRLMGVDTDGIIDLNSKNEKIINPKLVEQLKEIDSNDPQRRIKLRNILFKTFEILEDAGGGTFEMFELNPTFMSVLYSASIALKHNEGIIVGKNEDFITDADIENFINEQSDYDFIDIETTSPETLSTSKDEVSSYSQLPKHLRALFSSFPIKRKVKVGNTIEYQDYENSLGLRSRMDPGLVFGILSNILNESTSKKDMMHKLELSKNTHAFIPTLLDKIRNNNVLKTQLYKVFRKDFQPYVVQIYNEKIGSIETLTVNRNTNTEDIKTSIKKNIETNSVLSDNSLYDDFGIVTPVSHIKFMQKFHAKTSRTPLLTINFDNGNESVIKALDTHILPLMEALGIPVNDLIWSTLKDQLENNSFVKHKILLDLQTELETFVNFLQKKTLPVTGTSMIALTEGLFSIKDPKAYYTNIANLLGKLQPVVLDNYVRTKDKSHFSNVYPSFLGTIMSELHSSREDNTRKRLKDYLNRRWLKSNFFKKSQAELDKMGASEGTSPIFNKWLRELEENPEALRIMDWSRTLTFPDKNNKHKTKDYSELTESDHKLALFNSFYGELNVNANISSYPLFITGDVDALRFIRFFNYSFEENLDNAYDYLLQELWKVNVLYKDIKNSKIKFDFMKKVTQDGVTPSEVLQEYKFSQLQFLNKPEYKDKLVSILTDTKGGISFKDLPTQERNARVQQIKDLLKQALLEQADKYFMDNKDEILERREGGKFYKTLSSARIYDALILLEQNSDFLQDNMDIVSITDDKGVSFTPKEVYMTSSKSKDIMLLQNLTVNFKDGTSTTLYTYMGEFMMKYQYINHYMSMTNQISMFTIDPMFYEGEKDLQKRFKEMIASGSGLDIDAIDNWNTVDENNPVYALPRDSRGNIIPRQVIYFKDEKIALDKTLDDYLSNVQMNEDDKIEILDNLRSGSDLTDGQVFISLSEYRAIKLSQGEWSTEMQSVYTDIKNGKTVNPSKAAIFNPLKPYTFTFEEQQVGNTIMLIPVQHKSSEIPLIAEFLPEGKLKYMAEYMEGNYHNGRKTVFASNTVVKVGEFASINLDLKENITFTNPNQFVEFIDEQIKNTPGSIHQIDFADYRIQNNVPFSLHKQSLLGTQSRKLIVSGIVQDKVYQYVQGTNNEYKKMTGKELLDFYNDLITEEFIESADNLQKQLNTPAKLYEKLAIEMSNNDRSISDIMNAFELDAQGNPVLSTSDFVLKNAIETSLTSIIDKEIRQIKVTGGSAVNATSMGISLDMSGKFVDAKGKQRTLGYHKNPDGTIDMECVMPMYDRELFEPFMDKITGKVDMEAADKAGLLNLIGYRIPTEHHYSMFNLRIVDFSNSAAGGVIYLPAEITKLAGLDFDIDKLYLMFRNFTKTKVNNKVTKVDLIKYNFEGKNTKLQRHNAIFDILLNRLRDPEITSTKYKSGGFEKAKIAARIEKIFERFTTEELETHFGITEEDYNDPTILDTIMNSEIFNKKINGKYEDDFEVSMDYADIQTHATYAAQNKLAATLIGIFANQSVNRALGESLPTMRIRPVYRFMDNSLTELNKLNVNREVWVKLENGKVMKKSETINVSDIASEFTASSVDAVKEPVLNFLNLNQDTANIAGLLGRSGYTLNEIGMFLNQPIIKYITEKLQSGTSYDQALAEVMTELGITKKALLDIVPNVNMGTLFSSKMFTKKLKEGNISESKSFEYREKLKQNNIQIVALFNTLFKVASDYNQQISNSRFTSSSKNHSTYGGLARKKINMDRFADVERLAYGTIEYDLTKLPVRNDLKWNSFEELRESLNSVAFRYEQALYEISTKHANRLFNNKIKFLEEDMFNFVSYLNEKLSNYNWSKQTINSFFNELLHFNISTSGYFDYNTFMSNIKDFLDINVIDTNGELNLNYHYGIHSQDGRAPSIPDRFAKILYTYPNIAQLPIFRILNTSKRIKGENVIGLHNESRWTEVDKEIANISWKTALNLPQTLNVRDPFTGYINTINFTEQERSIAKKLAEFLFYYQFHTYGIGWDPNSVLHISPTSFRTNIEGYKNSLEYFDNTPIYEPLMEEIKIKSSSSMFEYNNQNKHTFNFIHQYLIKMKDDYNVVTQLYPNDIEIEGIKLFGSTAKSQIFEQNEITFRVDKNSQYKDLPILPEKLELKPKTFTQQHSDEDISSMQELNARDFKPAFMTSQGLFMAKAFVENPNNNIKGHTITYIKVYPNMKFNYTPNSNIIDIMTRVFSPKLNENLYTQEVTPYRVDVRNAVQELIKENLVPDNYTNIDIHSSFYINKSATSIDRVFNENLWENSFANIVKIMENNNLIYNKDYEIHHRKNELFSVIRLIQPNTTTIPNITTLPLKFEHVNDDVNKGYLVTNNTIIGTYNFNEIDGTVLVKIAEEYSNAESKMWAHKKVVEHLLNLGVKVSKDIISLHNISEVDTTPNNNGKFLDINDKEVTKAVQILLDNTGNNISNEESLNEEEVTEITQFVDKYKNEPIIDKFGNKLC